MREGWCDEGHGCSVKAIGDEDEEAEAEDHPLGRNHGALVNEAFHVEGVSVAHVYLLNWGALGCERTVGWDVKGCQE